jgi:dTDP-L-rhamnose 4-epimerase
MKILITGGAGFIGKWLVAKCPIDWEIVIIDSLDPQVHSTSPDFAPELTARAKCIKADVQDIADHLDAIEGTDVIIHLAAQTGTGQSMYELSKYVQHNANGTAKLLELIAQLQHQPRRVILASSRAVYGDGAYTDGRQLYYPTGRSLTNLQQGIWDIYGADGQKLDVVPMRGDLATNPTSVYGLTKLWQEQLIRNFCASQNIDVAILRFQNVYGPYQELGNPYTGIVGIFTNAIACGNSLELFEDGLVTRDFVFVGDVAEAVLNCAIAQKPLNTTIDIGSGQAVTLIDIVETIAKLLGKPANYRVSGRFRVGDIRHAVADLSRYEASFGAWQPTSLADGLARYLEWYLLQAPLDPGALQTSLSEMAQKGLLLAKNA